MAPAHVNAVFLQFPLRWTSAACCDRLEIAASQRSSRFQAVNIEKGPATLEGGPVRRGEIPAIDHDDVQASARVSRMVTVVTISGEIDISNSEGVSAFIARSVLLGNPILLDLSRVSFFAVQSVSLLSGTENACRQTDLPWVLVAGEVVQRVLRYSQRRNALPIASSVPGAMAYFAQLTLMQARPRKPLLSRNGSVTETLGSSCLLGARNAHQTKEQQ